jgi:hypothetical protein
VRVKTAREAKIYAFREFSLAERQHQRRRRDAEYLLQLKITKEELDEAEERLKVAEERARHAEERKLATETRHVLEETNAISEDDKRILEKEQAGAEAPNQSHLHITLLLTF